jgi:hypothetical protein
MNSFIRYPRKSERVPRTAAIRATIIAYVVLAVPSQKEVWVPVSPPFPVTWPNQRGNIAVEMMVE